MAVMEPDVTTSGQRGCSQKDDGTAVALGGSGMGVREGVGIGAKDGVGPGLEAVLEHAVSRDIAAVAVLAAVAVRKVRRRMGLLKQDGTGGGG